MPCDCGLFCLLTDRRRYCEILWRRRFLITNDERKAKRRFLNLMRGFDTEDLRVLRRAVESCGHDIKQCAPGPPMDLVEEEEEDDLLHAQQQQASTSAAAGCSTTVMSSRPRHSINRLERDRLLFQRQRFPELLVGGGGAPPLPPGADYVPHYRKNSRRKSSAYSRRYAFMLDENGDHVTLETHRDDDYYHYRKPSTSQHFFGDEDLPGDISGLAEPGGGFPTSQNEDLGLIPQIDRPMSMPYLCCKMWRWKDLQVDAALHRLDPLPWCRFGRVTINNATVSCCNPFHYGLWIRPEHSPSLSSADEPLINSGVLANGGILHDNGFGDCPVGADYDAFGGGGAANGAAMSAAAVSSGAIGHVRSVFKSIEQHIKGGIALPADDLPPAEPPPPIPPGVLVSGGEDADSALLELTSNHVPSTGHYGTSTDSVWGRMARWERKQRIGEVVALVGQFIAVGRLAGTVFDGQDVKSGWDLENQVSFSLIKQTENENFEDIWLYNSGDRPLFLCVSRSLNSSARSDTIRRLSPGYCIRVHRILMPSRQIADIAMLSPPVILSGSVDAAAAAAAATFGITKSTTTAGGTANAATTTTVIGGAGRLPIIATTTTTNAAALARDGAPLAAASATSSAVRSRSNAPSSVAFLTISVGVGWGINYQRLYVTDVPCRYEIIFS